MTKCLIVLLMVFSIILILIYTKTDNFQNISNSESNFKVKIEPNCVQICIKPYDCSKIPPKVFNNIYKLNKDYNYYLFTDDKIQDLLNSFPKNYKEKISSIKYPQHKADYIRMLLLYTYGGVYFDLDQEPLVKFDNIIADNDFVAMIPNNKEEGLQIGFLASVKRSSIISAILDAYMKLRNDDLEKNYFILCVKAGEVLKKFLSVKELNEGEYNYNGQKIRLISEKCPPNNIKLCKGFYKNIPLFNIRYDDYPWKLK